MQAVIGIEDDSGHTAWYRVNVGSPDAVDISRRDIIDDPTPFTDLFARYSRPPRHTVTFNITGELIEGRYDTPPGSEPPVDGHALGRAGRSVPGGRR